MNVSGIPENMNYIYIYITDLKLSQTYRNGNIVSKKSSSVGFPCKTLLLSSHELSVKNSHWEIINY